jgi:tetratricopeptide (TPR) repeat protein
VVAAALAWLDQGSRDRPFFLWTHFFDPHHPYRAPREVLEALPPAAELPGSEGASTAAANQRRSYLAEVAGLDAPLARLLDAARSHSGDGLLTVLLADHGEALGEHGEFSHGYLLHDAVLRIPLVFHHPRLGPGRSVAVPVSIVDVAPTLLALLGLPAQGMSGADLGPLLLDPSAELSTERPLYMETCTTWFAHGWSPLYALVTGPWKVVLGPQDELFELASDPSEDRDLSALHREPVLAARQRIAALASAVGAPQRHGLSREEQLALRSLGYAAGPAPDGPGAGLAPGWIPDGAEHPRTQMQAVTRFWQAHHELSAGRRDEALAQLRQLVRDEPDDPYLLHNAGALLANHGHPDEALPLLERAVALGPDPESRLALAAAQARLGRRPEAVDTLVALVERSPELLVARWTLAELLIGLGRAPEAVPHLEAFLQGLSGEGALRQRAEELLAQARSS